MTRKKEKNWKEAELIQTFNLNRIIGRLTPKMQEWLNIPPVELTMIEQANFDAIHQKAVQKIAGWSEEDLKMKFISFVLELGNVTEGNGFVSFFEKTLEAEVNNIWLKVKTDFLVAKGLLNLMEAPYFHFHEYKPQLNPTGEPMAQLLEAMLIAQHLNNDQKPIYGCEIIGKQWTFVILEGKDYCVSSAYDCTKRHELLQIITILRQFRYILETELIVN
jgi:hypothetical protein